MTRGKIVYSENDTEFYSIRPKRLGMKRLKICASYFKICVVSMITRFQVIYTQLRRRRQFLNKRFWIRVVVIFIFFYILQSLFRQISELSESSVFNMRSGSAKSRTGLKAEGSQFTLDGKPFTILSGAIHYFRVVPEYWEDRLRKLKALGLNTVETCVSVFEIICPLFLSQVQIKHLFEILGTLPYFILSNTRLLYSV